MMGWDGDGINHGANSAGQVNTHLIYESLFFFPLFLVKQVCSVSPPPRNETLTASANRQQQVAKYRYSYFITHYCYFRTAAVLPTFLGGEILM